MSSQPNFQLFTSLRFDPRLIECRANTAVGPGPSPFYMLRFHRDRMLEAAQHFGWTKGEARLSGPSGLEHLLDTLKTAIDINSTSPLRVRTVMDYEGNISVKTSQTPPRAVRDLFPTIRSIFEGNIELQQLARD